MASEIKLSRKQKEVIGDMRDGFIMITDSSVKGAWLSKSTQIKSDYHIDNGVFLRLVNKGLVAQQFSWPFNYELTPLGKSIKLD